MMGKFARKLKVFIILFFVSLNSSLYSQNDSLVIIENIEEDHPLLEMGYSQKFDLDALLKASEDYQYSIDCLFYSINFYLDKDTCLSIEKKEHLRTAFDSLESSFNNYIESILEVEHMCYGDGHQAGIRTLMLEVMCKEEYLNYLRYWTHSFYNVYLEPGVVECGKQD